MSLTKQNKTKQWLNKNKNKRYKVDDEFLVNNYQGNKKKIDNGVYFTVRVAGGNSPFFKIFFAVGVGGNEKYIDKQIRIIMLKADVVYAQLQLVYQQTFESFCLFLSLSLVFVEFGQCLSAI